MGNNIDNNYDRNKHITDGKERSNPWTDKNNGLKLIAIPKVGCCNDFKPNFTYGISEDGNTVTMTPTAGQSEDGLKHFKWSILDDDGNEAFGAMDVANPGPVQIDTSNLNLMQGWAITFSASVHPDVCKCPCPVEFCRALCCGQAQALAGGAAVAAWT